MIEVKERKTKGGKYLNAQSERSVTIGLKEKNIAEALKDNRPER